jgi:hypothetical protein
MTPRKFSKFSTKYVVTARIEGFFKVMKNPYAKFSIIKRSTYMEKIVLCRFVAEETVLMF